MRTGITILFFLLFFCFKSGFSQEVKFFSKDAKEVQKEQSYYYEIGEDKFNEKDTIFTFYTASDKIRSLTMVNEYGNPTGYFVYFHENGKVKSKGKMEKGLPIGLVSSYYPNGKIQAEEKFDSERKVVFPSSSLVSYYDSTGNQLIKDGTGDCICHFSSFGWMSFSEQGKLVNGKRDSDWVGFNPILNQKFHERYKNGELLDGESIDSLGSKYTYTQIEEVPEFKGGVEAMQKIVVKNTKYPVDARRYNIEGKVFVGFVVFGDGSVGDFQVLKGINPSCDKESLRVIRLLKDWKPGKTRGMPVDVKFVYPLKFVLD